MEFTFTQRNSSGLFAMPKITNFYKNVSLFYHQFLNISIKTLKFIQILKGVWNLILHTEFTFSIQLYVKKLSYLTETIRSTLPVLTQFHTFH